MATQFTLNKIKPFESAKTTTPSTGFVLTKKVAPVPTKQDFTDTSIQRLGSTPTFEPQTQQPTTTGGFLGQQASTLPFNQYQAPDTTAYDAEQAKKEQLKKLQDEARELAKKKLFGGGLTDEEKARQSDVMSQSLDLEIQTEPITTGLLSGFTAGLSTEALRTAKPESIEKVEQDPRYTASKITGDVGRQFATYGAVAPLVGGAAATTPAYALGQGTVTNAIKSLGLTQAADLFVDTLAQAPAEIIDFVVNDKTLDEGIKDMFLARQVDVGFNLAIGGIGEAFKELLKNSRTKAAAEKALKEATQEQIQAITQTMAKDTQGQTLLEQALKGSYEPLSPSLAQTAKTGDQFVGQTYLPKDVPMSDVASMIQTTTKQTDDAINAFQAWRSQNFGGATGNVLPSEMDALLSMYKQDTGIDLETIIKNNAQTETMLKQVEGFDGTKPTNIVDNTKIETTKVNEDIKKIIESKDIPGDRLTKETLPTDAPRYGLQGDVPKVEEPFVMKKKQVTEVPKTVTPTVDIPRQEMFPTPEVGTSKSPFIERIIKSDETTAKVKRDLKSFDELPTTSNIARTEAAQKIVTEDLDTAINIAKDGDRFDSGIESEIARLTVDELQKTGRNAEAVEIISKMSEKFRKAGQDVQAASIWSKTTPEGMQKWAVDTLEKSDVKVDPDLIAEVGQDMKNISEMTPDELAKMVQGKISKKESDTLLNSIKDSYSYDQLKAVNTAITMQKVINKVPVLQARKLSTVQAMSHLLNLRTFNRNILGNTVSIAAENMSKLPASMVDRGISAFTNQRSVVADMPKFKQALNEGWNQGKRSFFEISAGVGKGKTGKYEALFGNTFNSKVGKTGEKLLSWSLQTPDEFFKGFTKADSVYNQVRSRLGKDVKNWSFEEIMSKATAEEIEKAAKEAEFVTFQNDSFLADLFGKTKSGLNWASSGAAQYIPGLKNIFTDEFGLGDMVIKYTRVPGNIITRGLEYSPAGYLKGVEGLVNLSKTADIPASTQRDIAMQLGRATTGTGLMAVGALLHKTGVISGVEQSSDYDVQAFNKAEGGGDYKLNMSALSRLVKGESAEQQDGDKIVNYNWLEPIGMPLAVGARISQEQPDTPMDLANVFQKATIEEATDLSTMYIIKQMMYESMKEDSDIYDIASIPLKEAIPGFIPSAARQLAQTIDPVIRDTSGGANVPGLSNLTPLLGESVTGKIQANLPVLSEQLPAKLDPLGQEQERATGVFANMLNPATQTTLDLTDFGEQLRQLSNITNETGMYPDRKAPSSISRNNESLKLTADEKNRWQEIEGQEVERLYTRFLDDKTVTDTNAQNLVDALEKLKTRASEKAKLDFLKRRREDAN